MNLRNAHSIRFEIIQVTLLTVTILLVLLTLVVLSVVSSGYNISDFSSVGLVVVTVSFFLVSLIVSFGVASLLQRPISRQIAELARTAEAAREATETQAKELARSNSELEQFAYIASHDLQEPLRTVSNYTELLAKRYRDQLGPEADEFIGYITDGTKQMRLLINDLLTLSRLGTQGRQLQSTDCEAVFKQVVSNLQPLVAESGAIISADALPEVQADETQLRQLFQNLLSNAIKFRSDRPLQIHLSVQQQSDDECRFCLRDNGIGIESQYFDKIFVIFQRLHSREKYGGTGMGLAICKKIVERHGGKIWVQSTTGEGTNFYFTLRCKSA